MPLTEGQAQRALRVYASIEGGDFHPDALSRASASVAGSPYMMHLVGHHSWCASEAPAKPIDIAAVDTGIKEATQTYNQLVSLPTFKDFDEREEHVIAQTHQGGGRYTLSEAITDVAARFGLSERHSRRIVQQLIDSAVIDETAERALTVSANCGMLPGFVETYFGDHDSRVSAALCNDILPRAGERCGLPRGHKGHHRAA